MPVGIEHGNGNNLPPPQESSACSCNIVRHFPSQCVRKYGVCHIAETQILGHLRRGRDLCLDAVMKAKWHLSEPSVPELTALSTTRPPILHPQQPFHDKVHTVSKTDTLV